MLELRDFTLTGNVVHSAWFQTITKANGKADLVTINILAEIVYWYKPTEVRDEQTGAHLGWRNKYKQDLLQKSYVGLADQFGLTERQAKESIKALEKLGVVERVFRTITVNGTKLHNVLYIKLNIESLKKISSVDTEVAKNNKLKRSEKKPRKKQPENTRKASVKTRSFERGKYTKSGIPHYTVPHPTLQCGGTHTVMCPTPQYNDTPPTVECGGTHTVMCLPPHCNVILPTVECDTYTEITTETSTEITTKTYQLTNLGEQVGKQVAINPMNVFLCYEQNMGAFVPQTIKDDIVSYLEDGLNSELINQIIKHCAEEQKRWKYAKAIFNACVQDKIYTVQQYQINQEQFRASQSKQKSSGDKAQLVSKNPQFTHMLSHGWDLDNLDQLAQDHLERQLEDYKKQGEQDEPHGIS